MDNDLARVANDHWRMAYRALIESVGGDWHGGPGLDWFVTPHIPAAIANGCLALGHATPQELRGAIDSIAVNPVDFRVHIDTTLGANLLDVPLGAGLERKKWDMPAMVLTPVPGAPVPPGNVVAELVEEHNYEQFLDVMEATGVPREVAQVSFGRELLDASDIALFLGRLNGEPAAVSLVLSTDDVAGIYAVATVEEARRRGLGAAVTWAAVEHARATWDSQAVVLQASEMGLPVYEKMGFAIVTTYASYGPGQQPTT